MNWFFATEPPNRPAENDGQAGAARVGDVMTRPALVVREDATLAEVAGQLLGRGSDVALVVDAHGHLRGIITEADFVSRAHCLPAVPDRAWHVLEEWQMRMGIKEICASANRRAVSDLMSPLVVTAREDELVTDVVARMIHHDLSHLPVVREGKLVGVIARRDVLRLIASAPPASPATHSTSREG
jgi:CBS domain-containing protein